MKNQLSLSTLLLVTLLSPALFGAPATAQEPAATVSLVTGLVTVAGRAVSKGDAVNAGDTISVGNNSYASLSFRDGGRIVLRPGTEFQVETYEYSGPAVNTVEPAAAAPAASGRAFFKLLRGGFRSITGLLGKANAQDYRVTTPVATIGIRGTDYEAVLCEGDCPVDQLPATQKSALDDALLAAADTGTRVDIAQAGNGASPNSGLVVGVNDGSVGVTTPRGTFEVNVGQFLLALQNGSAFVLPVPPDALLLNPTPSPERCR